MTSLGPPRFRPEGTNGALAQFVGDPQRFLTDRWGKRAHLHQGVAIQGLLGVEDVDHILATMALRAPALRVVRHGETLPQASYTRNARIGSRTVTDLIDVARVYSHFTDGATIVLQGLHRFWEPVTELCRGLEEDLTHPLQANAYITPPEAQGLRVHADAHDVFALQTHGRKHWVVYEGEQDPGPDGSTGTPTLDVQLWPTDCLYLPKGTFHAARTIDSPSIHLTLGVRTMTWGDVLRRGVDRVLADLPVDEPLPPGFANDPAALAAEGRQRFAAVAEAVRDADPVASVEDVSRRFGSTRQPALTGQLHQLLVASDVYDRTVVRRRPHATWGIRTSDHHVDLELSDRTLRMPRVAEPALQAAMASEEFTVADLREHLDEAGRSALVRRLVREGLFMVVNE